MPRSRLQPLEQVEDLRLDRDVERGGRLVGDQQRRVAGERHGDRRALAHAAGELVRILRRAALPGRGCRRRSSRRTAAVGRLAPRAAEMDADRLGDLLADGVDRVEAGQRLLEDDADVVAADAGAAAPAAAPASSTVSPSLRRRRTLPAAIAPVCRGSRPTTERLVTDLPDPDSPTSATVSPAPIDEVDVAHGRDLAAADRGRRCAGQ